MILRIERYLVPSGRAQQKGRNDCAWLEAETDVERDALRKREMAGLPTRLRGSSAIGRDLDTLRQFGKSIDPGLKRNRNGSRAGWRYNNDHDGSAALALVDHRMERKFGGMECGAPLTRCRVSASEPKRGSNDVR